MDELKVSDKSLKWWADNSRDVEMRFIAQELQEARSRLSALQQSHASLQRLMVSASHGFRSYQYGNSSTELAEEMADAIDAAIAEATPEGDSDHSLKK